MGLSGNNFAVFRANHHTECDGYHEADEVVSGQAVYPIAVMGSICRLALTLLESRHMELWSQHFRSGRRAGEVHQRYRCGFRANVLVYPMD